MAQEKGLLPCYNRGCGQKFAPDENKDGTCTYHPGVPVFHDAYKGWSCCSKKCTDFTEFLNIKGCSTGFHTNEKPPEPEKPPVDKAKADKVIEVKPMTFSTLKRPPFDSPRITIEPIISPNILERIQAPTCALVKQSDETEIKIGQSCLNKSCKATYRGLDSLSEVCTHHPGIPIFHEGLKYWSCCPKKKTTDFSAFLAQPGCTEGLHQWIPQNTDKQINCRMDWHQTPSFVEISIFAKNYDPSKSSIRLNPIRLSVDLFFIEGDSYNLDIELRGVVDIEKSSASMLPTKVEIKLKKAEPGSWAQLSFPRSCDNKSVSQEGNKTEEISDHVEAIDLSDL